MQDTLHRNRSFSPLTLKSYLPLGILAPAVLAAGLSGILSATAQPAPPAPGAPPPPAASQGVGTARLEGEVREIFGDKVIVEGPSGRVLVETGPEGSRRTGLAIGDKLTVEGAQRDGFVHAFAVTKSGGPRIELARGPEGGPGAGPGPRPGGPLGRGPEMGPGPRPDGPRGRDEAGYREQTVLDAVRHAGFRDARVIDVKKHHAEVEAVSAEGRNYELHVEFDGNIRTREDTTLVRDEAAVRGAVEKAGYTYGGQMRPEKKHVVVTATNARGERVELDVHRDGTIRKERRVF